MEGSRIDAEMRAKEGDEKLLKELRALRRRVRQVERRLEGLTEARPQLGEDRIKTFVSGFDDAMNGGVPGGHIVILHGPAGTMKTSLALYLASKNRERGMRAAYISLEETRDSLQRTMEGLGVGGEDFIVDIATMRLEHGLLEGAGDWLDILRSYLGKRIEEGLDLLVIDPFNFLYTMADLAIPRQELLKFFQLLRDSQVTSFLVYEGMEFPFHEDYMVDGVLQIVPRELAGGRVALWIRCAKLRQSEHSRDHYQLSFRSGRFAALPVDL